MGVDVSGSRSESLVPYMVSESQPGSANFAGEYSLIPAADQKPTPIFECRFAQVEYLEELGMNRTAFEVFLGERPACESIGFDHEFDPTAMCWPHLLIGSKQGN